MISFFGYKIESLTGGLHLGFALICLALGPLIFLRRKGTRSHRLLGRSWALMMLIMNISALMTYDINGKPNMFHAFAILNLCALIPAFIFIRRYIKTRNPRYLQSHKEMMVWAYFGLLAAGVWQGLTGLIRFEIIDISPALFFGTLGALTCLTSFGLGHYLSRQRLKIK